MSTELPPTTLFDPQSLARLRYRARQGPAAGAGAPVAGEFEAVLLQTLLKSLRAGLPASGLGQGGAAGSLFSDLLDQQRALEVARGRGLGLAPLLTAAAAPGSAAPAHGATGFALRDVTPAPAALTGPAPAGFSLARVRRWPGPSAMTGATPGGVAVRPPTPPLTAPMAAAPATDPTLTKARFIATLRPHAQAASQATGIPAHFLLAQAALETGWGEKVLKNAEGLSSYNAFNLKAGSRWSGPTLARTVREYDRGAPVTETAAFRMYPSFADSFQDYARLLTHSQRYAPVLGQQDAAEFARTMQQAGFATDPGYAHKLVRIIQGTAWDQGAAPLG